jgi:hypothetical protein
MQKPKLLFLDRLPTFIVENVSNFYLSVVLVGSQIWQGPFLGIVISPTSPSEEKPCFRFGKE